MKHPDTVIDLEVWIEGSGDPSIRRDVDYEKNSLISNFAGAVTLDIMTLINKQYHTKFVYTKRMRSKRGKQGS